MSRTSSNKKTKSSNANKTFVCSLYGGCMKQQHVRFVVEEGDLNAALSEYKEVYGQYIQAKYIETELSCEDALNQLKNHLETENKPHDFGTIYCIAVTESQSILKKVFDSKVASSWKGTPDAADNNADNDNDNDNLHKKQTKKSANKTQDDDVQSEKADKKAKKTKTEKNNVDDDAQSEKADKKVKKTVAKPTNQSDDDTQSVKDKKTTKKTAKTEDEPKEKKPTKVVKKSTKPVSDVDSNNSDSNSDTDNVSDDDSNNSDNGSDGNDSEPEPPKKKRMLCAL